jgi:hypothetical protein
MNISRLHFAHLPTPIETLARLSETLSGPRLLIKRDDQTGLAFGGNKDSEIGISRSGSACPGREDVDRWRGAAI